MIDRSQKQGPLRTGKKTGIWLALTVALGLHVLILLLPVSRQITQTETEDTLIEVQLTVFKQTLPADEPIEPESKIPPPEPALEPIPDITTEALESVAETLPEIEQEDTGQPMFTSTPRTQELTRDLENMYEPEKNRLTNSVLTRQYITEKSATDQLFGRPLEQRPSEFRKEFHYPVRQNMIAMLDQPMEDLPFEYTPGLIRFAYEPGLKGDLQRFWDVITPEFGWRTKYGTEVKCIWVLVIGGCAWK